ncbi:MAG: hypothetical protein L6V93_07155 [Clostridiales bacterium]|nr:MAG: hypothetical protein L6V93_07155 [Clostridiales bacterium]
MKEYVIFAKDINQCGKRSSYGQQRGKARRTSYAHKNVRNGRYDRR